VVVLLMPMVVIVLSIPWLPLVVALVALVDMLQKHKEHITAPQVEAAAVDVVLTITHGPLVVVVQELQGRVMPVAAV